MQTAAIVPVWLSSATQRTEEVLVYALLDSQSDTTFVLSEVADALDVEKGQVKLKLSTMTSTTVIQSQRVKNLQVRGFHLGKRITLPPSYTRDFIPANRTHIPTKETAKAWSHLEHLREHIAPLQSCEVGILIGYNCSQALLPREVVAGQANQPFAQRTDLGWSIVGHGNPCVEFEDAVSISHRIVTMRVSPDIDSPVNLKAEVHYVNRIQRIKSSTNPDQWAHVASKNNPADYASRGLTAEQLKSSNWFSGPEFLWQQELPHREGKVGEVSDEDPELRKATVLNTKAKEDRSLLNRLEKFSDWSRAVQAVARLKRLIKEHKGVKERTNESTSLEERKKESRTYHCQTGSRRSILR